MPHTHRRCSQTEVLHVLDQRNRPLSVDIEAEASDSSSRDVVVDDAVETEPAAIDERRSAEMAALELAFAAMDGKPGLLGLLGDG